MHIQWEKGIPGRTSKHKCPTGYRGIFCLAFEDFISSKKKETV
jgi:hypothetical protein